jgi:hypothetical protein
MKKLSLILFVMLFFGGHTVIDTQSITKDSIKADSIINAAHLQQQRHDSISAFELFMKGLIGQELTNPK